MTNLLTKPLAEGLILVSALFLAMQSIRTTTMYVKCLMASTVEMRQQQEAASQENDEWFSSFSSLRGQQPQPHHRHRRLSETTTTTTRAGSIIQLRLINADTDMVIIENLRNEDGSDDAITIDLEAFNMTRPAFNIEAVSMSSDTNPIQFVEFGYNKKLVYSNSTSSPFTFCGYNQRNNNYWWCKRINYGKNKITATPYYYGSGEAGTPVQVTLDIVQRTCPTGVPQFLGEWERTNVPYPISVAEAQGGMIGNDLVLVSGFTDGWTQCTSKTYARNVGVPGSPTWRELDDLPLSVGITHAATVVVGGSKLYLCGGYVGGHPGPETDLCFIYDHDADAGNQWQYMEKLPEGRSGGGMIYDTELNALIFASGATRPYIDSQDPTNSVDHNTTWIYQFDNPGWQELENPLPYAANHMSYVTVEDQMGKERHFFLGGQHGYNEFSGNVNYNYELDTETLQWIPKALKPLARGHASSSTRSIGCNGFVVVGGSTNYHNGKTSDISYYGVEQDVWTRIGDLPWPINTPVCDINNGYLYCESGRPKGKFSWRRKIGFSALSIVGLGVEVKHDML